MRRPRLAFVTRTAIAAALIPGFLLGAVPTAQASTVKQAAVTPQVCVVTGGQLSWGFKEPTVQPEPPAEPKVGPTATTEEVVLTVDDEATTDHGLVGWGVTAVVLAIIAAIVAWLLSRRRKAVASAAASADEKDAGQNGSTPPRS